MTIVASCAVALAQLLESVSRLVLAVARMSAPEDIEGVALAVDRLAYDTEHRARRPAPPEFDGE